MGETLHREDGEEPPPASGAPELMKETLDLLNLEVTVELDLLHGYGEIPIVSESRRRSNGTKCRVSMVRPRFF